MTLLILSLFVVTITLLLTTFSVLGHHGGAPSPPLGVMGGRSGRLPDKDTNLTDGIYLIENLADGVLLGAFDNGDSHNGRLGLVTGEQYDSTGNETIPEELLWKVVWEPNAPVVGVLKSRSIRTVGANRNNKMDKKHVIIGGSGYMTRDHFWRFPDWSHVRGGQEEFVVGINEIPDPVETFPDYHKCLRTYGFQEPVDVIFCNEYDELQQWRFVRVADTRT